MNWLVCLLYFKGSVRLTLFGVSGRPEILMRWRDVNATGIFLAREVGPCSCCRSPGIREQCTSALRFQKHERHYQIDSFPGAGWVAVPGGHSLVFSDSELIKARGDRKAMLSLHFGEGGNQQRADSCNPTVETPWGVQPPPVEGSGMVFSSSRMRFLSALFLLARPPIFKSLL